MEHSIDDRIAIEDALNRYCHGVDRCDLAVLQSAFWEDGTDDHGDGPVNAHAWASDLLVAIATMRCTQHAISNVMIDFSGGLSAKAQTYVVAYHQFDGEDGPLEMVVGGRYLDHFEKRSAEWKIVSRVYVMDWNRTVPSAAMWSGGLFDQLKIRGARYPEDPSQDFVARP